MIQSSHSGKEDDLKLGLYEQVFQMRQRMVPFSVGTSVVNLDVFTKPVIGSLIIEY